MQVRLVSTNFLVPLSYKVPNKAYSFLSNEFAKLKFYCNVIKKYSDQKEKRGRRRGKEVMVEEKSF